MIKEVDTIVLSHDIDEYGLKKGDIGVVVHVYPDGAAYEVEFVTADGRSIAVLTLDLNDIRLILTTWNKAYYLYWHDGNGAVIYQNFANLVIVITAVWGVKIAAPKE